MNGKAHIDKNALVELRDLMGDEFGSLIRAYLKDCRQQIDALQNALQGSDADAFVHSAHSVKGSSGNMGALLLGGLCLQAEMAGKNGHLTAAPEMLGAIEREFAVVSDILKDCLRGLDD
jgi:HPt (histidine-containing phosphotransfer) domain-containing protein